MDGKGKIICSFKFNFSIPEDAFIGNMYFSKILDTLEAAETLRLWNVTTSTSMCFVSQQQACVQNETDF